MTTITVQLDTPICRSFRVEQIAGMFDVPIEERVRHELTAEVPGLDEPWTIGAIVGPSGSGKTTLARGAFRDSIYRRRAWPKDRAIIDVLGTRGPGIGAGRRDSEKSPSVPSPESRTPCYPTIKEITRVLTAVGLGSPPTWLKPYRVLSTGERFRADLARAILQCEGVFTRRRGGAEQGHSLRASAPPREESALVIDEFTGSLDRTVAKTTSAALSRLVRTLDSFRFVAVTCHHDILRWLAPDWILELGPNTSPKRKRGDCGRNLEGARFGGTTSNTLAGAAGLCARLIRQRPRKPRLYLQLDRVPQALWSRFQAQHYLSGGLAASATCYAAFWNKEPLVFCAVVAALGWPGVKRIQRLVTLPEFQGLGIGGQMLDKVAQGESGRGFRVTITASHPAILAHCSRSPRWRFMDVKKNGSTRQRFGDREIRSSLGRAVAAFEFVSGE